ncbi:MAG: Gfo/Idh/MocA family oxidoreductase [Bacteroidia bacterium]|nr:Gfo/Idh/MocA family oxidoreductase [Bacteroidia bacterium]
MASDYFKFVVIGYGHIGKRHADTIMAAKHAELVAIIDSNPIELPQGLKKIPVFTSIESFQNSNIHADVANICTPNGLHSQQAIAMLNEDCNVIIEKPMGLSAHECRKVIDLANRKSKKAYCVMQNRYSPPAKWLKSIHEEGKLGEIHLLQINCFWNRDERYYKKENGSWRGTLELDGGTLYTQFSHFIDLVYWVFGDLEVLGADFHNFNHKELIDFEDSGLVRFKLDNGGLVSLNYSTSVNRSNFESSISIIAEHGTVKIGGQYMNKVEYCDIANYEFRELPVSNPPNDYGTYKGSANNHPFVLENVLKDLKGEEADITTAEEGMKIVELIEEIYKRRNS